jgi:hypothetical protein
MLGRLAIGPLTIDTYLPALPSLSADLLATDAQAQLATATLNFCFGQRQSRPML